MRSFALLLAFVAGIATGQVAPGPGDRPARVGVLVDQTAGARPGAVATARAHVARLEARGVDAELRIVPSPSAAVGAAATLVSRGADRLVVYGMADARVLAPLRDRAALDVRR